MRRSVAGLLLSILTLFSGSRAFAFDDSHAAWTALLKKYQTAEGRVRYAQLKADVAASKDHDFPKYLASLEAVTEADFGKWSKENQQAFLINAYNALTIKLILDNYPVASIRKIGGLFTKPWSVEFFSLLGGKLKALDPIEHEWLRPKYKDYRVHAAVNCASASCPPLRNEAFVGAKLNEQLDDQMRKWLADPTRNQYDAAKGELHLSKIFDWYKDDFETWGGGVTKVVDKLGPDAAKQAVAKGGKIDYLDYDWALNEAK